MSDEDPAVFPFVACGSAPVDLVVRVMVDYSAALGGGVNIIRLRAPNGDRVNARVLPGQEDALREACFKDMQIKRRQILREAKERK